MLPLLMLDTVHMLLPPTPDIPVLDMLDMWVMLDSDTDMLDIMASVRLKLKLMLKLTPSVWSMLDSPSITRSLPEMPAMLELSPDTDLMLLPPIPGMLVLDMLVMLDILAILVPTTVKLGRHWYADDWIFPIYVL